MNYFWTRLWAKLWGWELVWTQDHDGDIRLRWVINTGFGKTCRGISYHNVILKPDGTCEGSYVKRWAPAQEKPDA